MTPTRQMHANFYLLVAGFLAGILLSPFVLGRISPQTYDALFDAGEAQQTLQTFEARAQMEIEQATRIGATVEAILPELEARHAAERAQLIAARDRARSQEVQPLVIAVLLSLIVIMAIEALFAAPHAKAALRLATARYALVALWLTLILAVPYPLTQVSLLFVALLTIVALLLALLPLKSAALPAEET